MSRNRLQGGEKDAQAGMGASSVCSGVGPRGHLGDAGSRTERVSAERRLRPSSVSPSRSRASCRGHGQAPPGTSTSGRVTAVRPAPPTRDKPFITPLRAGTRSSRCDDSGITHPAPAGRPQPRCRLSCLSGGARSPHLWGDNDGGRDGGGFPRLLSTRPSRSHPPNVKA